MQSVFDSLSALPPAAALAVGTFDGVHLGHQAILTEMLTFARRTARAPWVLSFEGSPAAFLRPDAAPTQIYDVALQTQYLLDSGATLIRLPFTRAVAEVSATAFLAQLKGAAVFCGEDWRFGKGAEGCVSFLEAQGMSPHVVPYTCYDGQRISSTRIRAALTEGAMDAASAMLGRPWEFHGVVQHGRALAGKTFGVPTLNVPYRGRSGECLTPLARGVYHGTAQVTDRKGRQCTYPALMNFGIAPSVKGLSAPLFEVHLLDAVGDFYDTEVTLFLDTPRVREERKFESLEVLRAQIVADMACFRERFAQ